MHWTSALSESDVHSAVIKVVLCLYKVLFFCLFVILVATINQIQYLVRKVIIPLRAQCHALVVQRVIIAPPRIYHPQFLVQWVTTPMKRKWYNVRYVKLDFYVIMRQKLLPHVLLVNTPQSVLLVSVWIVLQVIGKIIWIYVTIYLLNRGQTLRLR